MDCEQLEDIKANRSTTETGHSPAKERTQREALRHRICRNSFKKL
jgi:hypothetical protein